MSSAVEPVIVQVTSDANMRIYNIRTRLTEEKSEDGCIGDTADLGAFGQLILAIRGVEIVRVQTYRIFVSKAVVYAWDEIQPEIMKILFCLEKSQKTLELTLAS